MSTTTPARPPPPRGRRCATGRRSWRRRPRCSPSQGTDASLEEVARRAGVGVGTLYRHFPTRAALVEHVYRDGVERLAAQARDAVERLPAQEALEEWVLSFADYAGRKRDNAAALRAALGDDSPRLRRQPGPDHRGRQPRLRQRPRRRGHPPRRRRRDAVRTVSGVCMAGNDTKDPEASRRMLRIVLDGLRFGAGSSAAE